MKKFLIVVGLLILVLVGVQWSRSDYRAFSARRDAWHAHCDVYRTADRRELPASQKAAFDACQRELEELTAYAKQKGWTK
jgi:hypothetical protein